MSDKRAIRELNMRRDVCLMLIRFLNDKCKDDPRYPDALKEYKRQLQSIENKITAITGIPPAIKIGLKTAKLFGDVQK
jgi:hypothetical protein